MNYEKKYKEALGWMQSLYNGLHGKTKEEAERYFPELKSEDERIRKALIEMVHDTTGDELWVDYNVHKEEALAWLEKQCRQKPTWSEEDKDVINNLLAICNGAKKFIQFESCSREDIIKCQDWLTTLKEKI